MAYHGYEEVAHTADIALRVWGEDFRALLGQAAEGLYDLMGIVTGQDTPVDVYFSVPQGTCETLLVDFLSELLFLAEEKGQALSNFSFNESEDDLSIRATGQRIISYDRDIKAVTFHNLNVDQTETGLEATITFDV